MRHRRCVVLCARGRRSRSHLDAELLLLLLRRGAQRVRERVYSMLLQDHVPMALIMRPSQSRRAPRYSVPFRVLILVSPSVSHQRAADADVVGVRAAAAAALPRAAPPLALALQAAASKATPMMTLMTMMMWRARTASLQHM